MGELFKGRDEFMRGLRERLQEQAGGTVGIVAAKAIHGLGGVGKTRVAVEYAWRYLNEYTAVLFIEAGSPEDLQRNLADLLSTLTPDTLAPDEEPARAEAVLRWLESNTGWLLILDNLDTPAAAQAAEDLLVRLRAGHVIITSRLTDWGAQVQPLELDVLDEEDAVAFLLARTDLRRNKTPEDREEAAALARELDNLALALEQAGAFIHKHRCTLADYRQRWVNQDVKVRQWYDKQLMKYPRSIATTWETSFEQLDESARELLQVLALLAPDPIPQSLFPETEAADALAQLVSYSLAKWDDDRKGEAHTQRSFRVHRLVQDIARERMPDVSLRPSIERALNAVDAAAPADAQDVRTWPAWEALRPHCAAIVDHADLQEIAEPTTRLMNDLGILLLSKCVFNEAEPLMRRALAIGEQSHGAEHPNVAIRLNNLAQLLQDTNRLAEAEPLMRRALAIDEQSYGEQHPRVARDLSNLAALLHATNRLAEAEPLYHRALAIVEQSYGAEHPEVALRLNNLAQLLQATNRLAEAEPLMRRALAIDEQSYGPEHPNVATDLKAQLLQATNRLAEAEPLMRRALEVLRASWGDEHPHTQTVAANHIALLQQMGMGD